MNFDAPLNLRPCCLNLRHKLMYVDPRQAAPGLVDTDSTTRVYLCMLTQEGLGPDDRPVSPGDCAASRRCFAPPPQFRPFMPSIDRPADPA